MKEQQINNHDKKCDLLGLKYTCYGLVSSEKKIGNFPAPPRGLKYEQKKFEQNFLTNESLVWL